MVNNRLAIIVLNWNSADDTIACINSLLDQASCTPDIILVDNDSHDDSVEQFHSYKATHNHVHLIENHENLGFAGGINTGIRYALKNDYQYIGTLNPDATAGELWTSSLVDGLDHDESIGIATGILARSDHKMIDTTGDFYTTWGIPGPRGRDTLLKDAPRKDEFIFGSTGGGFVARATMLQDIGMFDEKFFMYFEDVDLSFRAQLAGYKVRYIPKAIAYHKLSVSTNKVPGLAIYNTFKNLPMVFIKNTPFGLLGTVMPRFTLAYLLILGNAILHRRGKFAIKGWLMSIVYLPHALSSRMRIQRDKRVSAKYISSIILHDIPSEQTGLRKFRRLFTGK